MVSRYLFSKKIFAQNTDRLRIAFANQGMDCLLGYSVKTNNHKAVLTEAYNNGMYAEVVSTDELKLATQCGFDHRHVIFNGIIPDARSRYEVAVQGGIVNLNDISQLKEFIAIAERYSNKVGIGLRVNFDIGNNVESRFGIFIDDEEFSEAIALIKASDCVELKGFHLHATSSRDLKYWRVKAAKMAELAKRYNVKYLDFGSRFFGPMNHKLKEHYGYDDVYFEDYAYIVANALTEVFGERSNWPEVILEPGTPIVSNAVSIIAEVMNVRMINGKAYADINCSRYDFTSSMNEKFFVACDVIRNDMNPSFSNVTLAGNTCVEADVLCRDYPGPIAKGDYVLIRNVGAYSVSKANSFITKPLEFVTID